MIPSLTSEAMLVLPDTRTIEDANSSPGFHTTREGALRMLFVWLSDVLRRDVFAGELRRSIA
ncbi:hypothetical protein BH20ACT10_BH20ACT10_12920 [soil metagenome]|jgi:hypothetical protein